MTEKNKLMSSLKTTHAAQDVDARDLAELMSNPEYLRYSSSIINEALKDGLDVLQLPNGDIITTGTKIITNTYVWSDEKAMLVKARASAKPSRSRKEKAGDQDQDAA